MRSQQEAERAEQQRIKNLVLNYDLTDDQHDGEEPAFHYVQSHNSNRTVLVGKGSLNKSLKPRYDYGQSQHSTSADENTKSGSQSPILPDIKRQDSFTDETGLIDHPHGPPRQDKSGNTRSKQRARKLQLGDIDWYGNRSPPATSQPQPAQASLDDFIKEKKPQRSRSECGSYRVRHRG